MFCQNYYYQHDMHRKLGVLRVRSALEMDAREIKGGLSEAAASFEHFKDE
jgi:hypothetical protein